jgi:hypothetical protein
MQCTTTDLPASSPFLPPLCFQLLQIPFPASLLVSHPCKTPGCTLHPSRLCRASAPSGALSRSFCSSLCFQQLAASFSLFALFLHTPTFVFRGLQPLLQKHRGYGGQRGRGRSGGRAVNGRGRMRKRGPSGGGTLRRESPQQGQRPSSQNARVASARSQWPRASHCGLMHCTVKPGRNCISFSLTAATPFAAAARSETRIPLLRTAVGADSVAG